MFKIIEYNKKYEDELMGMIRGEGEDWAIYWEEPNASLYRRSFEQSITYLALADGKVCGYSRSLKDALFIYVCDLLVNEKFRGNGLGEKLMRCVQEKYPEHIVYIMSGNDDYYKTLDCKKEGSIYLLKPSGTAKLPQKDDYNGLMETLYLTSIPDMKEKILDGKSTPLSECLSEDEVE